jgi:tetratricopeptide (TPR) repeat protein
LNPVGHHLTNNILHALNAFLVVLLAVRLLEAWKVKAGPADRSSFLDERGILITGVVTGLLFGIHPLHVESVAWVAERKDLLCALFFLLSIMMYMKYVTPPVLPLDKGRSEEGLSPSETMTPAVSSYFKRVRRSLGSYLLSLAFFTLALLSKPMAVSLPVVLLLLDWFPFEKIRSLKTFRASFVEKLPFIALGIGSSILTILAQKNAMILMDFVPFRIRALVAVHTLIAYLRNIIFPLRLTPFYPYPGKVSFFSPEYFLPGVLLIGLTAGCLVIARRQKWWLSLWGYYVATLLPVLGIVQVGLQSMADRYMYLPALGPFLIAGLLAARVSLKMTRLQRRTLAVKLFGSIVTVLLLGAFSLLTIGQIEIWKNSFTLWTYIIEREPERAPFAYNNRGLAFYRAGQLNKAMKDYNRAIVLKPSYYEAYYNRGIIFDEMGQFSKAMEDYTTAIVLNPSFYPAYNNRGILCSRAGLFGKAIEDFNKAIAINPKHVNAYSNRGLTFTLIDQYDKALEDFSEVIEADQNNARGEVYVDRGRLYLGKGNKELAVRDFQRACDLGDEEGCKALKQIH